MGLLTALAVQGFPALDQVLRAAGDGAGAQDDRIKEADVTYGHFAMERPALFRLMFPTYGPDHGDAQMFAAVPTAFRMPEGDIELRADMDPARSQSAMGDLGVS